MPAKPQISVVIPVHNEQDDVAELTHRLIEVLGPDDEIIFVDDGSCDATWQRLEKLHQPGRVRLVKFRTNFGKAAALMAGFALTRGELVFTMDGDLQDDPSEIPRFIERLDEGFDLVSGWKKTRHDPINKVIASRIFNSCVRHLTQVNLHDMNCGFKCYRGDLARSVRIYGELHRFIPALAAHGGYRVGEIEVRHQARQHGHSKYGFSRLFKGFFDLITVLLKTRFADRPSHGFGFVAMGFGLTAMALLVAQIVFPGIAVIGGLALFLGISAVILLSAGWVAEISVANSPNGKATPWFDVEETRD